MNSCLISQYFWPFCAIFYYLEVKTLEWEGTPNHHFGRKFWEAFLRTLWTGTPKFDFVSIKLEGALVGQPHIFKIVIFSGVGKFNSIIFVLFCYFWHNFCRFWLFLTTSMFCKPLPCWQKYLCVECNDLGYFALKKGGFLTLFVIGVSCNHPQFLPVFRFLFALWANHRSPIFWYYIEKFGKACLHFLLKIHGQWTRCWKDIQVDRVEIACLRKWMIFTLNVWYLPVSCISSCF